MLALGWEKEVSHLGDKYGWDLPLLNTLGYAEMSQYIQGEISLAAAIDLTVLHTRQFAKRQRTWFRAIPEIEWFDSDDPILLDRVWNRIGDWEKQPST
jgi:tRNA dimethylallyltransferase